MESIRSLVSDITYIATLEGWLYLAIILELFSRKVVGWKLGETLAAELVVTALENALTMRTPDRGLYFHCDRGSQYSSQAVRKPLSVIGANLSMSGLGNCYDNAKAEAFFSTLKSECLPANQVFESKAVARRELFEYIETYYNNKRLHSALGYLAPRQFEAESRHSRTEWRGWRNSTAAMKTLKKISVFGFLALAGCVGSTGYQPIGFKGGYIDKMTSADTAAVGFQGNGFTDITRVRAMLLLRCAELTLEHGYRYFVITGVSDMSRLSSFTTPGTATTTTYGNISGLGYGSDTATLMAQSYTTTTPPRTVNDYKPALVDWIKMSNSEKALEPYKPTKDFPIGDAAVLVPRIRQSLGIRS